MRNPIPICQFIRLKKEKEKKRVKMQNLPSKFH